MTALIDKVIAVHNIGLPYDIADEINGYCFYDHVQVSARKAKNIVNFKISTSLYEWYDNGHRHSSAGFFYSIPDEDDDWPMGTYTEQQFQCSFCMKCGNYIEQYLIIRQPPSAIVCVCSNHQTQLMFDMEQDAQQEPDDLYWIETETELDPIETAYAQWRDDYYYYYNN